MRLLLLTLALVLMGQECETPPPGPNEPNGGTAYCHGLEYTVWDSVVDGVKGAYNTIIGGEVSTNRRATVQVFFGQAYCSGVALSPHTVLTAAHCGYGETTTHTIRVMDDPEVYQSSEKLMHPDYAGWIAGGDREARKSDLMLLFTDQELPPPYIPLTAIYDSSKASTCYGLIAQGYGRAEVPKPSDELREGKYKITQETEKHIISRMTDVSKICYGDSGGGLYADVGPGTLELAGITTTTMSADCLAGGSHVKVAHYQSWLTENVRP